MCEWLSGGEWCDVQILCGGRYFNAHRAVLASVSTFLRGVLLSCPPDETTALIVLPDFDIEAMSSVLYYIYKGEVIVQKSKLELFLDIIQAMKIYIDCQYLSDIREDVKKYEQNKYCESVALHNEIFTLRYSSNNYQNICKIKKCEESHRIVLKYSQSDSDFHDNSVRAQNESELGESRLGNLKLPYDDRQRNSLLRDLYIETYPQNGNVNGLTESVQVMSNGCYRSPASVLLPNANCRHLSIDDAHTLPSKSATSHGSHLPTVIFDEGPQRAHSYKKEYDRGSLSENPCSLSYKCSSLKAMIYGNSKAFLGANRLLSSHEKNKKEINPSFDAGKFGSHSKGYPQNMNTEDLMVSLLSSKYQTCEKIVTNSSTKAILNHVLESPWNARKPNNYRPFRRKEKQGDGLPNYKKEVHARENDNNNNIKKSPQGQEEKVMESRDREIEELMQSSPVENRESFKCIHCDQVFTSAEALAVHMRRHSSNARYTCGECGKTFSQLRNFKYHMSIHRGTREFAATCSVCGKYFNDRGYLSSHMKIHRNRKEYKCSLCPKSFNQRVAYNMHVRIHTGVKPHVCEECGKAFSRKMLLKQHQRTHSGERPYACSHCDKRFADRSNMTLHLRLHTGVKPFSCPMCPKSFTKKHHLKSHLNFHTGSKPYSCPRCMLAFTQSSNMRTHYKKCTAPEPSTSNENSTML